MNYLLLKIVTLLLAALAVIGFSSDLPTPTALSQVGHAATGSTGCHPWQDFFFVENSGQYAPEVRFRAASGDAMVWLTDSGVCYHLLQTNDDRTATGDRRHRTLSHRELAVRSTYAGTRTTPLIEPLGERVARHNYLVGSSREAWLTDVPSYEAVEYRNIYPGVDVRYYFREREFEFDLLVAANADPGVIEIDYEGQESISLGESGRLLLKTALGDLSLLKPQAHQLVDGKNVDVEACYTLRSGHSVGFEVGGNYNPSLPLVIDPVVSFSTYLGGSATDFVNDITVDDAGCFYVTGYTESADFPISEGDYDSTFNLMQDAFVTKITPGGTIVYSTYIGGSGDDEALGIAVDNDGYAYLTGATASTDFLTDNGLKNYLSGAEDAFVLKLSPDGDSILFSTYLGGTSVDNGFAIAVDADARLYVAGVTSSTDFPTVNPVQDTLTGVRDVFVCKVTAPCDDLIYSTYLGGLLRDDVWDIAVDTLGCAYLAGETASYDYPVANAFQDSSGGLTDAFLSKLNPAGDDLVYSTYIGGTGPDGARGIEIGSNGAPVLVGVTGSSNFPTLDPLQVELSGASDIFVVKVTPAGDAEVFGTFIGGTGSETGYGCDIGGDGSIYLVGESRSTNFPEIEALQDGYGGQGDAFFAKLSGDGSSLLLSTYFGGSGIDEGYSIAVDYAGRVLVGGITVSGDFPTGNALQDVHGGGIDGFLVGISQGCPDADADLVCNDEDNCVNAYNPGQEDYDGDGIGDVCDSCSSLPPEIQPEDTLFVRAGGEFTFLPTAIDPENDSLTFTYLQSPHWCEIECDSIWGLAPAAAALDTLTVVAADSCSADTCAFLLSVFLCGDVDQSGSLNVSDAVALVAYIFGGGVTTPPFRATDMDCSGSINVSDAVYLVAYIFGDGDAPCADCWPEP